MDVNTMFKCEKCGTVVEVVFPGTPAPDCCGDATHELKENSVDAAKEKHVPVIEKVDGGYKVTVGSVEHPMTPEHWITAIELIAGNQTYRQTLKPGEKPTATFKTDLVATKAREYCNLHGLWVANA